MNEIIYILAAAVLGYIAGAISHARTLARELSEYRIITESRLAELETLAGNRKPKQ